MKHLLACAAALALAALASPSRADDAVEYVAPLSQTTQPSYVPQSVALSGPPVLESWHESEPVPPGYRPKTRARTGLIVAGASVLGSLYLTSVLAAQDSDTTSLAVPVIGPFLQIASGHSESANSLLVVDGLGQVAGAILLLVGLTTTSTVLVRNDLAEVHIAPIATGKGGGAGLVGRF